MKQNTQNQFNPELDGVLTYVPDFQDKPFTVTGLGEALLPIAEQVERSLAHVAVSHVQPPRIVSEPTEQYLNLGALHPRQEARMALKALAWDIKTLGRNNEYRRFKERVAAEKVLAMDMELGLVQSVHCRLHERMLKR
jgi:hypothetical protein